MELAPLLSARIDLFNMKFRVFSRYIIAAAMVSPLAVSCGTFQCRNPA